MRTEPPPDAAPTRESAVDDCNPFSPWTPSRTTRGEGRHHHNETGELWSLSLRMEVQLSEYGHVDLKGDGDQSTAPRVARQVDQEESVRTCRGF